MNLSFDTIGHICRFTGLQEDRMVPPLWGVSTQLNAAVCATGHAWCPEHLLVDLESEGILEGLPVLGPYVKKITFEFKPDIHDFEPDYDEYEYLEQDCMSLPEMPPGIRADTIARYMYERVEEFDRMLPLVKQHLTGVEFIGLRYKEYEDYEESEDCEESNPSGFDWEGVRDPVSAVHVYFLELLKAIPHPEKVKHLRLERVFTTGMRREDVHPDPVDYALLEVFDVQQRQRRDLATATAGEVLEKCLEGFTGLKRLSLCGPYGVSALESFPDEILGQIEECTLDGFSDLELEDYDGGYEKKLPYVLDHLVTLHVEPCAVQKCLWALPATAVATVVDTRCKTRAPPLISLTLSLLPPPLKK